MIVGVAADADAAVRAEFLPPRLASALATVKRPQKGRGRAVERRAPVVDAAA